MYEGFDINRFLHCRMLSIVLCPFNVCVDGQQPSEFSLPSQPAMCRGFVSSSEMDFVCRYAGLNRFHPTRREPQRENLESSSFFDAPLVGGMRYHIHTRMSGDIHSSDRNCMKSESKQSLFLALSWFWSGACTDYMYNHFRVGVSAIIVQYKKLDWCAPVKHTHTFSRVSTPSSVPAKCSQRARFHPGAIPDLRGKGTNRW